MDRGIGSGRYEPKKKPRRVDVNRGFSLVQVGWREASRPILSGPVLHYCDVH